MVNRLTEYEQAQLPSAAWRPAGDTRAPSWQDRVGGLTTSATKWVTEHPEIALTAAVAIGVVLGWFIKRR